MSHSMMDAQTGTFVSKRCKPRGVRWIFVSLQWRTWLKFTSLQYRGCDRRDVSAEGGRGQVSGEFCL